MSAQPNLLQIIAGLLVHVFSFKRWDQHPGASGRIETPAERAAVPPPGPDFGEREGDEREREIRVMMATWM